VNDLLAGGREVLSTPAVVVINVVGVWVVILLALYLARFVGLGLGLIAIYLTLLNALVHDTGKALMTHSAACFRAGESAFQPSSNSPIETLVSSSGWMRNHAT